MSLVGRSVDGMSTKFGELSRKWEEEIAKDLSPRAKEAFLSRYKMTVANAIGQLSSHEAGQLRAADIGDMVLSADTAVKVALDNYRQDDAFSGNLETGVTFARQASLAAGKPFDEAKFRTDAKFKRGLAFADNGDIATARRLATDGALPQNVRDDLRQYADRKEAEARRLADDSKRDAAQLEREFDEAEEKRLAKRELLWRDERLPRSDYRKEVLASTRPTVALKFMDRLDSIANAQDRDAAKTAQDLAKQKASLDNVALLGGLLKGWRTDQKTGRPARMSAAERDAVATQALKADLITYDQWSAVQRQVKIDEEPRVQQFADVVMREVFPKMADAFERDVDGNWRFDNAGRQAISDDEKAGKRRYTPATETGLTRTYHAGGKTVREKVLLGQAVDLLGIVKSEMHADPKLTPQMAVQRFKELAGGTLRELDGLSLADAIAEKQADQAKLELQFLRSTMKPVEVKKPAGSVVITE
jgi:hypothetical protein